ncbi:hypothetical protein [Saccharopolyspora taberi]|uniref:Uncharacterized protein n=1 Tax=Saccharopolyspora taberi TaxID=60895 RepID=A0ABN3VP84_9PSEU
MTATDSRTSASTAIVVPPQGLTVWTLHWWHKHTDEQELFLSYDDALHRLATMVRDEWDEENWRDELPASHRWLNDGQVVSLFYGAEIQLSPTQGHCEDDRGFEITEDHVHGSEPGELELRLATLRVLDEAPDDPHEHPLTYCLDAIGLTVAVYPGRNGPMVHVSNDSLPAGLPVTITLDDVSAASARHVYRLT